MALTSERNESFRDGGPLPDDLNFSMNSGGQGPHCSNSSQLALVDDGNPVAQRFRVRKNMGGEENRLALGFQLLNQVSNFVPAHRIQPGHRLV